MAFFDFLGNALGSIIGGVFNPLLGALGMGKQAADDDRSWQAAMQKSQNDWQSAENDKDRQFQSDQWLKQFEAENAEYDRRFQMSNEYNDPSAVMKRMLAAGINPAAAMGQISGTGGLAAAGGSSNPTSPSSMPSHAVTPFSLSPTQGIGSAANMASSIAQLYDSVTQRKRLGLDTKYQNATLQPIISQMKADARYKDSMANYQDVETMLQRLYGHTKIQTQIQESWANAFKAFNDGNYSGAKAILAKTENIFLQNKNKQLTEFAPVYMQLLGKQMDLFDSEIIKNKADANLTTEEAKTERGLRPWKISIAQYELGIQKAIKIIEDSKGKIQKETEQKQIDALTEQLERERLITKELSEKIKTAMLNNDHYTVRLYSNILREMISGGAEIYNARTRRKALKTGHVRTKSGQFGDSDISIEERYEPYDLDDLY